MKRLVAVLIVMTIFNSGMFAQAADLGPTEQLKPALDEVIGILEDQSLKGPAKKTERRQQIMAAIENGFDFREMSRRVLGQTWNKITPEQREHFVGLMTKLLEHVYVGKLETYSGQKNIEFAAERVKGKRAQVTTLVGNEGEKWPIHYIMQHENDKWMVYDINIEGVSLIRNYMEQFKSILRKEQFEGLIKVIEEKNQSFVAENDAA